MKTTRLLPIFIAIYLLLPGYHLEAQVAGFISPDTVFVGQPVSITNTSTSGSTWYWNFCSGNLNNAPTGVNIGNPGNLLNVPTYSTLVKDGNECFSFISNQMSQSVIRYDHGSSFANPPSNKVDLGSFGVLSDDVEGIQIKKEGNNWIGFVCNYDNLVRLNFGTSLKNIPTATVIGPLPALVMAHGFLLIYENNEWTGLISCSIGNHLMRLSFGSSLMNAPTFENLGAVGSLNAPGQLVHVIEAGNNHLFVVNMNNSTLSRLDFGNSIKNSPSGVNLGVVGGSLAMGLTLLRDCGSIQGFLTRYENAGSSGNLLWKINFPGGVTGPVEAVSLGNIGALERPSLFSELFRQNDTLFVYASNRGNGTRTRLSFPSCNNATPPSSVLFTPPVFSYNQPGTYNIRLVVNEGLASQVTLCKSIVVVAPPTSLIAAFTTPDTVCVGAPVNIVNQTVGGTTYYWGFCTANSLSNPLGQNIGNPGNQLDVPVYMTLLKDGNTCYSFITNMGTSSVVRYNHGTSFSNNPVSSTNLGNFGMLDQNVLGIKICKENGQWIGFVADMDKLIRLNFGTSLANTPAATMLGPYAMLNAAHCIDIFPEGSTWVGYLTCSVGNKLVRLNFGNSLLNTPVLTDLGTPGALNMPFSFRVVKENNVWYALVANAGDNTLSRLTFGNSLLNNPTGVNLGVACPSMTPGGIALIRDCENTVGFQLNYSSSSPDLIWRLSFPNGITGPVSGTSLGNIGTMSRPAHFSELFRVGDTLFLYNTNRQDYTLTRLRFLPCTNASVPSSILYNPPSFSYSQPGTYNIQLIVNEGLPTQSTVCKNIVVKACPTNLTAAFAAPDTVCVGTPVNITNQTVGGESFYWNFCPVTPLPDPSGINIGNPGNVLNVPGYCTLVKDGNTCYSFITNQGSKSVVRYNHGTSFNNNPISWSDLGGFGQLSDTVMGIKIRFDNGQWIGIVNNNNRLVRLNFGTSPANTPSATLLGPYSMIYVGRGLEIIKEGTTWLGFISSNLTNRMIRLNFGSSLLNAPVLTDLGALGAMNNPAAFQFLKENGIWYCMVVNNGDNTITRLTFGNSLLNAPTGINIGTACPSLSPPGEISLIRDCQSITGFQLHYSATSPDLIWRVSLPSGITGPLLGASLGNIGSLARPNTFSELFRVGDTLFLYAVNRQNFTLTRLRFLSCSNPPTPSSDLYNPPAYTYSQPGTFNVQLTVNEGLPDQSNLCKQVIVIPRPAPVFIDTTLCAGTSWFAGGAEQTQAGIYHDTIPTGGGCDSIIQTTLRYKSEIPVSLGNDTIFCAGPPIILQTGVHASAYLWQDGSNDSTYAVYAPGNYWVIVTKDGCNARDSIAIGECVSPLWFPNVFTPNGDGLNETFHPVGYGVTKFSIMIYDRWGMKIYESDAMEPGWDGTIHGELCSDGVYMFIASYQQVDSSGATYHAHGSVTVLR